MRETLIRSVSSRSSVARLLLPLLLGGGLACRASAPAVPTVAPAAAETTATAAAAPPWWHQSMKAREQRLGWFRESRFGMFVHWGVYSHLGGVWEGKPVTGYAEHIQRKLKIPIPVYRERVAGAFNPTQFDADAWVRALKDAGMGYLIITAKHHDGFAMYDSAVSDYNVVKATPWRRDPMRALADAARKHGLKFGFYYSHAFDWGDANGPGNDWDYKNPGGDLLLHGGQEWWEKTPALLPQVRRYVDEKSIPQIRELIRKYDPEILWFDTPHKLPLSENLRILQAVREAKPSIVVNGRITQGAPGGPRARFGDYVSTTDKPAEFFPVAEDWEAIPTTNESYGWHSKDDSHKPASHFIRLLAKASARGGNVLLNIGPMGDGRLDPRDLQILGGVGAWMKVNGEAIRGTARTPLPVQAWGESTRKGDTLYLHVFSWPPSGRLLLGGLRAPVKRAYLLADPARAALAVERLGDSDVAIKVPPAAPDATDSVVAVEVDAGGDAVATDPVRLLSTEVPVDTLRAFDGELRGEKLSFASGKAQNAYVQNWSAPGSSVGWRVRLREEAMFTVAVDYEAPKTSVGGTFLLKVGDKVLPGTVAESPKQPVSFGKVKLPPGVFEIAVQATKIAGPELMRLKAVTLTPAECGCAVKGY